MSTSDLGAYATSNHDSAVIPADPGQRVRFGGRDDDSMPVTWAERGLTWLHDTNPNVFANMMLAIVGVEKRSRST